MQDRGCELFHRIPESGTPRTEPALKTNGLSIIITQPRLQAYWVDDEVWAPGNGWKYRDWVKRYLVMPPFTQHGDAPQQPPNEAGNDITLNGLYKAHIFS